jgi:hypothetical protein
MRASFENMQRGAVVSEGAGGGFDQGTRAADRNNQPEDRDALRAPTRRLLLRERGTAQDAAGEMKVAEAIDIEFLQAERLQHFTVFHQHCPMLEVVDYPSTTGRSSRCARSATISWHGCTRIV